MSQNNHALDTEYKGGVISPPPNKVDLEKIQKILDEAKSVGYQGITDIPLLPKYKENFDPIPLCIPPVTQLLKALKMKVYEGSGIAGEVQKRKEELEKSIKKALELNELVGKFGSGLTNNPKELLDKIESVAGPIVDTKTKEGIEAVSKVYNQVKDGVSEIKSLTSKGTKEDPVKTVNTVLEFSKMKFLDFSAIDVGKKKTDNKLAKLVDDPEFVITQADIDRETNDSVSYLRDFEKRFSEIQDKFLSNLESYPEKVKSQYYSSLTAVDVARSKDQLARNQLDSRYPRAFGRVKETRPDVPAEWLPKRG